MIFSRKSPRSTPHFVTTIGFGGLQVVFATFIGHGVTHFKSIGLTQLEILLALLSGPICGAVFQPYFGNWSDRLQSPWGRRKPFIVIGTAVLILSILLIAWAEPVARLLIPSAEHKAYRICLVTITLISTISLFAAVQAVQVGLRTLVTDGCTPREQLRANAWASFYSNLTATLGNLSAYMDRPYTHRSGHTVFMDMSLLASVCLASTVLISCITATELIPRTYSPRKTSQLLGFRAAGNLIFQGSSQLRTVCLVQFFAWSGWFPFLFYMATYVDNVRKNELCTDGFLGLAGRSAPRMGSLALFIYSAVALIMVILIPALVSASKAFAMRHLWAASHGIFAFSMLATMFVKSSTGTIILFAVVGFSWAASAWIPYTLLGIEASQAQKCCGSAVAVHCNDDELEEKEPEEDEDDNESLADKVGLMYGVHNLSICLPQVLMCLGMALSWALSDVTGNSRREEGSEIVWVLRLGGLFALVAMYIARGIQEPLRERLSDGSAELDLA